MRRALLVTVWLLISDAAHAAQPGDLQSAPVYVEEQAGDEANPRIWDERITAAIQTALAYGRARTVVFPPYSITITKPIRPWRIVVNDEYNTTGDQVVRWNDQRELWRHIKGGRQHAGAGLVLEGASRRSAVLWAGGEDGVMLDYPHAWEASIRMLKFDGRDVPGVVGIRLRPGWDFQHNTFRQTVIEECGFEKLHVAVWIGDPFGPDITSITLRACWVWSAGYGIVCEGPNVTMVTLENCVLQNFDYAGILSQGYTGRAIRTPKQIAADPDNDGWGETTRDFLGREFSTSDLANTRNKAGQSWLIEQRIVGWDDTITMTPRTVGGGPDVLVHALCGGSNNPAAITLDANNGGRIVCRDARIESLAPLLRLSRVGGTRDVRNASAFEGCSFSGGPGVGGYAAFFDSRRKQYLVGCFFNGPVWAKGTIYDVGTRWGTGKLNHVKGQVRVEQEEQLANGWVRDGPSGSVQRTGRLHLRATPVRYEGKTVQPGFVPKGNAFQHYRPVKGSEPGPVE